jgi:hypothetical protein
MAVNVNEIFDRSRRFVVVDHELLGFRPYLVLMTDVGWWADNIDLVEIWCGDNIPGGYDFQGMTLQINQESDLTSFLLRWSD